MPCWELCRAAREAFADPDGWREIMLAGMAKDFSWRVSAAEYARLYQRLADGCYD